MFSFVFHAEVPRQALRGGRQHFGQDQEPCGSSHPHLGASEAGTQAAEVCPALCPPGRDRRARGRHSPVGWASGSSPLPPGQPPRPRFLCFICDCGFIWETDPPAKEAPLSSHLQPILKNRRLSLGHRHGWSKALKGSLRWEPTMCQSPCSPPGPGCPDPSHPTSEVNSSGLALGLTPPQAAWGPRPPPGPAAFSSVCGRRLVSGSGKRTVLAACNRASSCRTWGPSCSSSSSLTCGPRLLAHSRCSAPTHLPLPGRSWELAVVSSPPSDCHGVPRSG